MKFIQKKRIEYNSELDALVAVAKRLSKYENLYSKASEEFYNSYYKGYLEDTEDFIEWANDYRHYLAIRAEIEGQSVIGVKKTSIIDVIKEISRHT